MRITILTLTPQTIKPSSQYTKLGPIVYLYWLPIVLLDTLYMRYYNRRMDREEPYYYVKWSYRTK